MTAVAVDIGGTKIAAGLVDASGRIVGDVTELACPADEGAAAVVERVVDSVARTSRGLDRASLEGVAISSAGVIDPRRGRVVGATSLIRGWTGTELAASVGLAIGLPVCVVGDGQAFAMGEAAYGGKAPRMGRVLVMAVGTGVGGGIVEDGRLVCGRRGAAGHVGHLPAPGAETFRCSCGAMGHLEAVAGGFGLLQVYRRLGGNGGIHDARQVFAACPADGSAGEAVAIASAAVGAVLSGLANVVDPDLIVVAGGFVEAGAAWRDPVREAFAAGLLPALRDVPLEFSSRDEWLALRGAVAEARKRWNRSE